MTPTIIISKLQVIRGIPLHVSVMRMLKRRLPKAGTGSDRGRSASRSGWPESPNKSFALGCWCVYVLLYGVLRRRDIPEYIA